MPRTTTLDSPGCPPIRALTFDVLGLIKVVEARGGSQGNVSKVVERWGEPESSRCVLAASIDDRKFNPLLAVARKCGTVEILNPLNGAVCAAISDTAEDGHKPEDDPVVGLHLFRNGALDRKSGSCTVLTCSTKGNARMRSCDFSPSPEDASSDDSAASWKVCGNGNILLSKVDDSESYAIFGGKGVEVNIWDIREHSKIWTAKPPPKNNLGIFDPTWFTSATFLCKNDYRKIVAGTNSHQVRLYDVSAQRRPVISFDFRETAIKAVSEDLDGYTVYVGNSSGDLASFDMRTGKMLGSFLGKCSGSIRSIVRHPKLPVLASCGLDSYLRLWDIKSRQLLSPVFLKQHLNAVVFDSNFAPEEEQANLKPDLAPGAEDVLEDEENVQNDDEEAVANSLKKRKKKASKEGNRGKKEKAAEEGKIDKSNMEETMKKKKKKNKKKSKKGEDLDYQQLRN